MNIKTVNMIDHGDLDALVTKTYGRIYSFQQQGGCKDRGTHSVTIPDMPEDYKNDTLPEQCNGEERGVSIKAWLEADPNRNLIDSYDYNYTRLWWERNFYPNLQVILNDLHAKGLVPAGNYTINIDW